MSIKKIHVIGTVHTEGGACTTQELIKVIQNISPDIIFCEAPYQIFPAMLNAIDNFNTPEINALRSIIKNHSIDIVPIDLYDDPFDRRLEEMQALFRSKIAEYFYATEIHAGETYRLGFSYLNSEDSDRILQDKSSMEKMFIARANHSILTKMYSDWLQWNDRRENHWINEIHNYFTSSKITTSVFLVGAAHRVRLIEKIKDLQKHNELAVNWDFYPFNTNHL